MGRGGELMVSGTTATISRNGEVRQDDRLAGQIKLVRFTDTKGLVALGGGLFSQGSAGFANDVTDVDNFRTGYQENSNVNSTQEMVRLSETMRHFESMQKISQGYDDVLSNAIRKLGEF
jgi:flagellar basal body rod protein FlgG